MGVFFYVAGFGIFGRHKILCDVEEEWVLDKVLKVQWSGKGRQRHREWNVLRKGHDKSTWEPDPLFFHHVAQPWRDSNAAKGLDLRISDIVQQQLCVVLLSFGLGSGQGKPGLR